MNKFFYKSFLGIVALFCLIIGSTSLVSAQIPISVSQSSYGSSSKDLLFGQHHDYTVVFRGNGEAIVQVKMIFENPNNEPLSNFSFQVPEGINISQISAYQVKLPQVCSEQIYSLDRKCTQYRDASYLDSYYGPDTKYEKVEFTHSADKYTLSLPESVTTHKEGAVILSYRSMDYAHKSFGSYKFDFQTLKVPVAIEQASVAIDADTDLWINGHKSEVNYDESNSSPGIPVAASSFSSPALTTSLNRMDASKSINKEVTKLSPNENFTVSGKYSESWFAFYMKSIFMTILILLIIAIGIYFISKYLNRRRNNNQDDRGDGPLNPIQGNNSQAAGSQMEQGNNPVNYNIPYSNINQALPGQYQAKKTGTLNMYALLGLLSALLVVLVTLGVYGIGESRLLDSVGTPDILAIIFMVTGGIGLILLYLLAVFSPAIFAANKYGWKSLVWVLLSEFLWFALFTILFVVFFVIM